YRQSVAARPRFAATWRFGPLPRDGCALHRNFTLEAFAIAEDSRHGKPASAAQICDGAIVIVERAVDLHVVPPIGVADIVDRDVVVLPPEERYGLETLATAEDIASGRLPLPLGDDPMLDANVVAGVRIGPSRDIAGGEDPGSARLEVLVDGDAVIQREP